MNTAGVQRTERKCFWVTNKDYAKTNSTFIRACEAACIKPTARQASKYRRKIGLAYIKGRRQISAKAKN